MFRHTIGGVGAGLITVGSYAEHALLQVCEDINGNRKKKVEEFEHKVNRESMN